MFTGIVETIGVIIENNPAKDNRVFTISSHLASELQVDQSVSHNGVCLTVSSLVSPDRYQVVAVPETLQRSNLDMLSKGDLVNLERAMVLGARLDGHLVQGHVDQTAVCKTIRELEGSWEFVFELEQEPLHPLVEKGSVCVNGISLTCYNLTGNTFQVSVIPYTYENTNFRELKQGARVNLEYDMIGKYVQALLGGPKL
jgi:riboflavin synthase